MDAPGTDGGGSQHPQKRLRPAALEDELHLQLSFATFVFSVNATLVHCSFGPRFDAIDLIDRVEDGEDDKPEVAGYVDQDH